jgi:hypothetical protein
MRRPFAADPTADGGVRPRPHASARSATTIFGRWGIAPEGLALGLILVAALVTRLLWLDSIPPGLWFDEAVDAHDALGVWNGAREIYFEGNLGREPLYMYALAPSVGLFGPGVLPIRLVSGLFGLAVVALTYPLGRALFDRRVALYATAFAAASYPLLHFSRTGFRAITLPAILALGLWLAWLALERGSVRLAGAGGGILGLTLYTYSSSRFVLPPLLVALAAIALVGVGRASLARPPADGVDRGDLRRRGPALAVATLLAAAIVALPLGLYFRAHPDVLFFRSEKMSFVNPLAGGAAFRAWIGSAIDVLRMFFVSGDGLARHNLPGRPLFDPVSGALFVLGAVLLFDPRWRRAGLFTLVWLAAALGPLTFTLENPHHLRAIGALPAIFLVAGIGLARVERWIAAARPGWLGPAVAIVALGVAAGLTARDYFVVWPVQARTYWETQADVAAAVRALPGLPPSDRIYLAADEYHSRPEPFTALHGEDDRVQAFNGRKGLVFPDPKLGDVLYLLPFSGTERWDRIERWLPRGALAASLAGPDGRDAYRAYRLPAASLRPTPSRPLPARFGDAVELIGYDVAGPERPGAPAEIALYWRILEHRWYAWDWRATLVDPKLTPLSPPSTSDSLVTNAWRVGDIVVSWQEVDTPPNPTTDIAYVTLGMNDRGEPNRVRIADGAGRDVGTSLRLGPIRLRTTPSAAIPPDLVRQPVRFGDAIELVGYQLPATAARAGETIEVTLAWRTIAPPAGDYSFTLQLLDGAGQLRAQADGPPGGGQLPTGAWEAGFVALDRVRLTLPTLPAGTPLRLVVGLYDPTTLKRLPASGPGAEGELAALTSIALAP